ncbi:hypothetical protein PROFUN_00063 [Planoprotostelium fungivorum]|uniref:Uncharacterized protein n=1 Tax=Planoprotostelium fungivorum TaxID=1890364 RepID=A0A2P6P0I4_9EUKA|nr:hypothetical protein PROFUN_00063 [Planoprotostelium fungivorum]
MSKHTATISVSFYRGVTNNRTARGPLWYPTAPRNFPLLPELRFVSLSSTLTNKCLYLPQRRVHDPKEDALAVAATNVHPENGVPAPKPLTHGRPPTTRKPINTRNLLAATEAPKDNSSSYTWTPTPGLTSSPSSEAKKSRDKKEDKKKVDKSKKELVKSKSKENVKKKEARKTVSSKEKDTKKKDKSKDVPAKKPTEAPPIVKITLLDLPITSVALPVNITVKNAVEKIQKRVKDSDLSLYAMYEVQNGRDMKMVTSPDLCDRTMKDLMDDWLVSNAHHLQYSFVLKPKPEQKERVKSMIIRPAPESEQDVVLSASEDSDNGSAHDDDEEAEDFDEEEEDERLMQELDQHFDHISKTMYSPIASPRSESPVQETRYSPPTVSHMMTDKEKRISDTNIGVPISPSSSGSFGLIKPEITRGQGITLPPHMMNERSDSTSTPPPTLRMGSSDTLLELSKQNMSPRLMRPLPAVSSSPTASPVSSSPVLSTSSSPASSSPVTGSVLDGIMRKTEMLSPSISRINRPLPPATPPRTRLSKTPADTAAVVAAGASTPAAAPTRTVVPISPIITPARTVVAPAPVVAPTQTVAIQEVEEEKIVENDPSKSCSRCDEGEAMLMCHGCGDALLCPDCDVDLHKKGKWATHSRTPV